MEIVRKESFLTDERTLHMRKEVKWYEETKWTETSRWKESTTESDFGHDSNLKKMNKYAFNAN